MNEAQRNECPLDRLVMPHGGYRVIVIDPPWRYKTTMAVTGNAPGRTKQNGRSGTEYPTMTINEIKALPISDLLSPDGGHVYMWTTNTHLRYAWDIYDAWGVTPKQVLTWAKKPKGMIGFGAFSPCSEFIMYGATGKRAVHTGRCNRTWFEWPRKTKHSAKPEGFQDIIEQICPGPRLEMFARRPRNGWTVWGNEV